VFCAYDTEHRHRNGKKILGITINTFVVAVTSPNLQKKFGGLGWRLRNKLNS
jgi:hypothetical protein